MTTKNVRLTDVQRLILTCNIQGVVAVHRRDTLAKLVQAGLVTPASDGRGGWLTEAGHTAARLLAENPDRSTVPAGRPAAHSVPRPPQLSPQQRAVLATADAWGSVVGHRRTLCSLVELGLVAPVKGWYERSISRRVGRLGATTSTWGVVGFRLTDAGRTAVQSGGAK